MIISKKVNLRINPSNIKRLSEYYDDLKNGEIREISVEHLSKSSHCLVDVVCDICLKPKKISYRDYYCSFSNGGYYTCSQKCSKNKAIVTSIKKYGTDNPSKSEQVKQKIKQTFLSRYGVENISFLKETIDKIKQTYLDKYGVENISFLKETIDKIKQTHLDRYGVENVFQSEEIKDKIKQTNLDRYGVEYANQNELVRDKIKQTNLDRYGVESPLQNKIILEKIKETNIKKYGFSNPFQSEEIKDKIKQTNLDRYGVEYASQDENIHQKQIESGYKIKNHSCGLKYQGAYEKEFIDFCIDNNIKIIKSPSFNYIFENKKRKYFPDFYYSELNLIIEVKSSYYHNIHKKRNELKKESVISNNFNYIMILDKNYDEFLKMINNI
jgi:hypothetical protein